jgi:hypothetical protein
MHPSGGYLMVTQVVANFVRVIVRFDSAASAGHLFISRESSMSHAEHASKPLPVFTKLAALLRNIPAVQFVFAKFAAVGAEPLISKFLGDAPGGTNNAVDQHLDILKSTGDIVMAAPKPSDQSEREKLIRRRWRATGIKMWNPDVHGAGHVALNIQGRVELLPPKPGETLPEYDKLEFKLIGGRIVCEGVVVDPPNRPGNSQFAGPATGHP